MRVAVIINSGVRRLAGDARQKTLDEVKSAFAEAGVESEVIVCGGDELAEKARSAAAGGCDVVVAAGGDGTVSTIAAALAGGSVPLAVLPFGTLNHFARDIGMPGDLREAAKVIAQRKVQQVDLAEVNGRTFINNSSIGLYPELVISREKQQRAKGTNKWLALLLAAKRVLARFPLIKVRVRLDARKIVSRTPFLFVGNNEYAVTPGALGTRDHLDGGRLSVYLFRCRSRLKLFSMMVRALLQKSQVADLESTTVTELRVDSSSRRLSVALDGEVTAMRSPLRFRIHPRALGVVFAR